MSSEQQEDPTDGKMLDLVPMSFGKKTDATAKQVAACRTDIDADHYSMTHGRRGDCHIFVHDTYLDSTVLPRTFADHDTEECRYAFENLGFEVIVHRDLDKQRFRQTISEASRKDHSQCDALVVIFMSHGGSDGKGGEVFDLYDGTIPAKSIHEPFEGANCPTLAGKPKMFFIQACRGTGVDPGVSLNVMTDNDRVPKLVPKLYPHYVLPSQADFLIMWASEKGKNAGMVAFNTQNNNIIGSVFIHFLCKNLKEYGSSRSLDYIVLQTTRCVATQYTSANKYVVDLRGKKQVPQIASTLMRRVCFFSSE